MRTQPAGEQTVAIGHMNHVARLAARSANGARHQIGPDVDVFLGVAHHRGLARGAAGGMDARDLLTRYGKQTKRVVVAQVLLGGEGELGNISQRFQVRRVHAFGVKGFAVMRHVVIGVLHRPAQALQLQRFNFITAGGFDRIQRSRGSGIHGGYLFRPVGAQ